MGLGSLERAKRSTGRLKDLADLAEIQEDNIRDAIRLHVEDRIEAGEEILQPESISLTSLEVAV